MNNISRSTIFFDTEIVGSVIHSTKIDYGTFWHKAATASITPKIDACVSLATIYMRQGHSNWLVPDKPRIFVSE